MNDPIDFESHRFEKLTSSYAEVLRQQLEHIQSRDISKLNGRELRKLRDRMLNIKWLLLACDPKTGGEIAKQMDDKLESPLRRTLDDLAAYVPEPPTVKFL